MKTQLKGMTKGDLKGFFSGMGEKPFRASQLFGWMYGDCAGSFAEMSSLPASLRGRLAREAELFALVPASEPLVSKDGTRKYLSRAADGSLIESAFMRYRHGAAVCVSSQAGCRMGCVFCASGLSGFKRNLTAGEMLDQALLARRDTGERVGHVTVMGTGEPLENFDELLRFVEIAGDEEGLDIGRRNITVSTCGILPGIERMASELPQVGLAVSLHAPNDPIRNRLMPVNKACGIDALTRAVRAHIAKTGRRATFEYALARGVNDSAACAVELARRLGGMNCHVNLIPLNAVEGTGFMGSRWAETERFLSILKGAGIQATVRRTLGGDIGAACGQLQLR
ncbi:MAG: 23S rRNA (adenine(2503)-C(2))-methyltransferase RlmN [Clostridiales Family XIII bacterium]|jgi:23S rRNA (adenine2503-C2)-methyltransferase|nr:23S rRNA (adenine(2503)-C(2))-methyltransferase RlmN [Clostridiales Family XIII bacterium]